MPVVGVRQCYAPAGYGWILRHHRRTDHRHARRAGKRSEFVRSCRDLDEVAVGELDVAQPRSGGPGSWLVIGPKLDNDPRFSASSGTPARRQPPRRLAVRRLRMRRPASRRESSWPGGTGCPPAPRAARSAMPARANSNTRRMVNQVLRWTILLSIRTPVPASWRARKTLQ